MEEDELHYLRNRRTECVLTVSSRSPGKLVVYYESIKREVETRPIHECRCDERLKTNDEESTRLACTELFGELEHLKIKTRLIDEMFVILVAVPIRCLSVSHIQPHMYPRRSAPSDV